MNTNNRKTIIIKAKPYIITNPKTNIQYGVVMSTDYPQMISHQRSISVKFFRKNKDETNSLLSLKYFILVEGRQIYTGMIDRDRQNNILPRHNVPFGSLKDQKLSFVFVLPSLDSTDFDKISFEFGVQLMNPQDVQELFLGSVSEPKCKNNEEKTFEISWIKFDNFDNETIKLAFAKGSAMLCDDHPQKEPEFTDSRVKTVAIRQIDCCKYENEKMFFLSTDPSMETSTYIKKWENKSCDIVFDKQLYQLSPTTDRWKKTKNINIGMNTFTYTDDKFSEIINIVIYYYF